MPILGTIASSFRTGAVAGPVFESIATVSLTSGSASSVEFTNIPQNYTHLQVRVRSMSTYTSSQDLDGFSMGINNDTGSNYSFHYALANVSAQSESAAAFTNTNYMGFWQQPNSTYGGGSFFAPGIIEIMDYRNTNKFKSVNAYGGVETNNTGSEKGRLFLNSGNWRSTSAITSLQFFSGDRSSNRGFAQYSHFALYGIKA